MKYVILVLIIVISIAAYLLWPVRYEPENWVSLRDEEKIETPKETKILFEKKIVKKKEKAQAKEERSEVEYITDIRDIIKDQWKELEECENDFDEKFAYFLGLNLTEKIKYLNDPSNLDDYLDNLKSFKGTTPSSGKMIKELADPLAAKIDPNEIFETVGYVKTCEDNQKSLLIGILERVKRKDRKTIDAVFTFLESEVSTLTYPRILNENVSLLNNFLFSLGIKKEKYPQIEKLNISFYRYVDEDMRMARNHHGFNANTQKHDFEFALIFQKDIQKALREIKKDLLKN